MERARHRRSRSITDIEFEGIRRTEKHTQKQEAVSNSSSDSSSYIDGTTRKDMFMLELGYSSPRKATGTLMELLAEEKSKEVEAKRRSPTEIRRLMSLDGLPSPRHVHRQRSMSSDSYRQKNASMNIQGSSQLSDGHSSTRSSMKKLEFKDVYDLEASHVTNQHHSSTLSSSSRLSKSGMALVQQRFMDSKCLSMDAKLQGLKQFDDTLEMVDSNTDLMLRFPQKPDSLCAKHLYDLQVHPPSSLGNHIAVLKPSNSAKYEGNVKGWESGRHNSCKHDLSCDEKREDDLLLNSHSHHRAFIYCKSENHSEENDEKITHPTRIVVLKPNIRKMHNAGPFPSLPDYSHAFLSNVKKLKEYPIVGGAETQLLRDTDSSHDMGFMKAMSREATIIARGITNHIRHGCDGRTDLRSFRVRGYAGDESPCDAYECDSGSELDIFKVLSRNSFCHNNWSEHLSSDLPESSFVSRESKKRLSERWKTTHKYQDVEMVAKASTLGEMLAIPDKETKLENVNAKVDLDTERDRLARNNGTDTWDGHSGISSRDGWKDKLMRSPSRSKSLPPSSGSGRNHKRRAHCDAISEDEYIMHRNAVSHGTSKTVKGNLYPKEDFTLKDLKSRNKKPLSSHHAFIGETDSKLETRFENQMETNLEKDPSAQQPTSQMAKEDGTCTSPDLSSKYSELSLKQSSSEVENLNTIAHNEGVPNCQEPHKGPPQQGSDPGSSENSLQADPSPDSVLEAPLTEDVSSASECFERVDAELHELRMQLQLLKMESHACDKTSTLISRENDVAQESHIVFEENYMLRADDWKASYVLDVLADSGFEESQLDMFRTTWYSSECTLSPWLFDDLEKKYDNNEVTGLREERRFLFDRINSALLEEFQQHVDFYPWVVPKLKCVNLTCQKQVVRDSCQKLLTGHDFGVDGDAPERILDRETQWLEFKGEIDTIGNELEKLLIDELITEFLFSF